MVQSVPLYHSIGTIVLLFHPIHWIFSWMGCYHGYKIIPSFFIIKEGSTFLTKPLFPQGREDVTALRCSEPLRYKVGGPKRSAPNCAGWGRLGGRESHLFHVVDESKVVVKDLICYIIAKKNGLQPVCFLNKEQRIKKFEKL